MKNRTILTMLIILSDQSVNENNEIEQEVNWTYEDLN
jgi:hypothetical protein